MSVSPTSAKKLTSLLADWFAANARPMPWRTDLAGSGPRDPYHCLVAEAMLQQTQVSRVLGDTGYFARFIRRFPTVSDLAAAEEGEVLALWSGLGYYRRAKHLHAAARVIVERFGGRVPNEVEELRSLPGVGRYSAGAIASIVFGKNEPIVDGNVTRVLMRLEAKPGDCRSAQKWTWERSGQLVSNAQRPGLFNEGMMELGATVCTPTNPRCGLCPLAHCCAGRKKGVQESIPATEPKKALPVIHCTAVVIIDVKGRVRLERRPDGLWAGLHQVPTLEGPARSTRATVAEFARLRGGDSATLRRRGVIERKLSHRMVRFVIYRCAASACVRKRRGAETWIEPAAMHAVGLSSAQRRVIEIGYGMSMDS